MTTRRRLLAMGLAVLLTAGAAQLANHAYLRAQLCGDAADRCEAGPGPLTFKMQLPLPPVGGAKASVLRVDGSTALIRRACNGALSFGLGARLDLEPMAFGPMTTAGGCIDLGRKAARGEVTGVTVQYGGCEFDLSAITAEWRDSIDIRASARLRQGSNAACSKELGDKVAAMGLGPITDLQVALQAGATLPYPNVKVAGGGGAETLLRQLLQTVPMAHELALVSPQGQLKLGLSSLPALEGGQKTARLGLTLAADKGLLEHLPAELRAALANGPLSLKWDLDHRLGMVRVQDRQVRRLEANARPAGVVDLAGECHASHPLPLHFVEAGDGGEAAAPAQAQAVLDSFDAARAGGGALVSVFVHGWQHSAAAGDSYVCSFATLMRAMDEMERHAARASRRQARALIGVYVGWPGRLYPDEAANLTTFWNRLAAADRLGSTDGVLRKLLQGLSTRLVQQSAEARPDRRSGLVVTGHSMGGRAVFHALKQALPEAASPTGLHPATPDLVLLVNPAFSANQFRALHERARKCQPLPAPMLLFSSEADGVTRQVYPAGQAVTFDGEREPRVPFLEHIYTAANFEEFVTHKLAFELVDGELPKPDGEQTVLRGFERVPAGSNELMQEDRVTVFRQPGHGRPSERDAWYRMQVLANAEHPVSACHTTRVMKVDARVLPNHGTIFTPPFMEYVIRLFNQSASR